MSKTPKRRVLYIVLSVLLLIIAAGAGGVLWLTYHYKRILQEQLPQIVATSTDSVYHITYNDVSINLFTGKVSISDVKLWPDQKQVKYLREDHRHIPTTLSTVSVKLLEATGVAWKDIITTHSIDCKNATVHGLKWLMVCAPRPQDSLFRHDKPMAPYLKKITAGKVDFIDPDITYHFEGAKDSFYFFIKGGAATLDQFAYNTDEHIDTSVFLYARTGKVRFHQITFLKKTGRYIVERPDIDFETGPNSVTLKQVSIWHMVDHDPINNKEKEIYDITIPALRLTDFNWNNLINNNLLQASGVQATKPDISVRYIDKNAAKVKRMGSYPHQLLLQVGLQTNLTAVDIKNGHLKYTEVTKKNEEAVIEFTNIHGHFANVTNRKKIIAQHKNCVINLTGKFMGKSEVTSTFNFYLGDTTGRFTMDGTINNMDGDEVLKQAQVFTFVAVTSFHLTKMDMHIEGDETYAKGDFTVFYEDLKLSLFKFKSKYRKGKHGPFSFLGSTLILYPSNPMPGKDLRKVSTTFARDTTKGFIPLLWQNIYRAAKKTAVRNQDIVILTDGKETTKGEQPKKGFFTRLFGKRK